MIRKIYSILKKEGLNGIYLRIKQRIVPMFYKFKWSYHYANKSIIVFESIPSLSDNTKSVFDELLHRKFNDRYLLIWSIFDEPIDKWKKKARIKNVEYCEAYPESLSERIRNEYIKKRVKCIICCNRFISPFQKGQKSFYLSHGMPIKDVSKYYTIPDDIDYCFITGEKYADIVSDVRKIRREKIVALGFPRNDEFVKEQINIKSILNTECEKIIMWYPTFRQHKFGLKTGSVNALPLITDLESAKMLNEAAKRNNVLIVVKPHFVQDIAYINDFELSNIRFVSDQFFFNNDIVPYRFLAAADALITDYSSIYYDYLLCDKPIGLIWDDYDDYSKKPGFAVDMNYYMQAGMKIYNIEEMIMFLETVAKNGDFLVKEREKIRNELHYATDGKNTQRVVDFIIKEAKL